jgi:BlaI family penicillinase repressor
MPPQTGIGRVELEILQYIQEHHPISVREVASHLAETKGHTRTTALNIMERLREKGYLVREKSGSVYRYSPSQPRPQFLRGLVHDFVDRVLGGSLEPFVAYLSHDADLSDEQLQRLRRILDEMDAEKAP